MNNYTVSTLLAACVATGAVAEDLPYSLPLNATNDFSEIGVEWAEKVSEATNGEINFIPDFNGALVSIPEALDAVGGGVVPSAQVIISAISGTIPSFAFIELADGIPVENPSAASTVAEIFPEIQELLAAHDVKALWMMPAFGGGIACRDETLETADEWNGKKVRAAGRWQSKQVEALGAIPVVLPVSEVYTALQNGIVDCALQVANNYVASSMYEVAPYFTGYDVTGNGLITVVGIDVWESMTDDQREAITSVSQEMNATATEDLRARNEVATEAVNEVANLHMMTPDERDRLLRKWDPVFRELMAEVSDDAGKRLVEKLYSYRPQQ